MFHKTQPLVGLLVREAPAEEATCKSRGSVVSEAFRYTCIYLVRYHAGTGLAPLQPGRREGLHVGIVGTSVRPPPVASAADVHRGRRNDEAAITPNIKAREETDAIG